MNFKLQAWVTAVVWVLLVSGIIFLQGCDDDTVCPTTESGLVRVTCDPDSVEIPWSLKLPGGLHATGVSDTAMTNMPLGEYVISWGTVEDWMRIDMNPMSLELGADSIVDFMTTYAEDHSPSGSIAVEPRPFFLGAPWVLYGPDGYVTDGTNGALILNNLEEGDYTLRWGSVLGWVTPDPDSVQVYLADEGSLTIAGEYVEKETGIVIVDANPGGINAPWHLYGPDGFTFNSSGDITLGNVMEGEYFLSWGPVTNWVAPESETLSVPAGQAVTFTGDYEVDLPVAVNEDILIENFVTVYEDMFIEGYESILHADHLTILLQSTVDDWAGSDTPLTEMYLDRENVAHIHGNLLGGYSGVNSGGMPVVPITTISIAVLDRMGQWEAVASSDPYFGEHNARYAHFSMLAHFYNSYGVRMEVDQTIQFVVTSESGVYQLLGIVPFAVGSPVATENISYDSILALFR